ncbi:hypothetical protein EJB05_09015, partial [Eragrostis curvula]
MDVTFVVQGETFKAHRMVLAMRSPVFKAEFCGQMREARMQCLTIEDMQPVVFRGLFSSRMMAAVAATPGYKNLKRTQPSVLAEEYEKKHWKSSGELT